jgi:hypothetical protein
MHAIVTTPAESVGACFAHFPINDSLPRIPAGSAHRFTHFEACSTFTRVTACMIAKSLEGPSTPKASTASLPPPLLRLLPAGATVAGRDSHPLNDSAFARRTETSGLAHLSRKQASAHDNGHPGVPVVFFDASTAGRDLRSMLSRANPAPNSRQTPPSLPYLQHPCAQHVHSNAFAFRCSA